MGSAIIGLVWRQPSGKELLVWEEGPRWIVNIHGAGYQFVGPSEAAREIIVSPN